MTNFLRFGLTLIALLPALTAWGEPSLSSSGKLTDGTGVILPGTTIRIASSEEGEVPRAEVSGTLPYPFDTVAAALARAENWCAIMPLHFNIKACTYDTRDEGEVLTLYSGRKTYQPPEDSLEMSYHFETVRRDNTQLSLRLSAERGPANTHDYRIALDAVPVEGGTRLRIRSSYRPSTLSSVLARTYLATLGRDKVGFSRIESDGESRPVTGIRGVIERNVMRYHFAIDAFLRTRSLAEPSRHEAALASWFKQNDAYPRQLHEMPEADYLAIKRKEWDNQQRLQRALNKRFELAAMP